MSRARLAAALSWRSRPAHASQAPSTGLPVHFTSLWPSAHFPYVSGPCRCSTRSSIQSLPGQPEAPSSPIPMHQLDSGADGPAGLSPSRYQTMLFRSALTGTQYAWCGGLLTGFQGEPYSSSA